jgi:DNA uptake protein ComE-like DNA-binding protein
MQLTRHPFFFTLETRRNLYIFCGLIAILIIYKHLSADRVQTQRIEALEAEVEELYLCIGQAGSISAPTPATTDTHEPLSYPTQPTTHAYAGVHSSPTAHSGHKTYSGNAASAQTGAPVSQKFKTPIWIDLNAADSTLLSRIPGIGEKTAAAILRYRQRLGGYTNVAQIAEAARWVTPEQLQTWEQQWLRVSADAVQQLPVNTAEFKDLLRHPYLDYPQVKAIFSLRQSKGRISSWDDLTATGIFSPDDVSRLRPYLRFD